MNSNDPTPPNEAVLPDDSALDAQLDGLLASAHWPEPDAASVERLIAQWEHTWKHTPTAKALPRARRRTMLRWSLAASVSTFAAAIVLYIVAGWAVQLRKQTATETAERTTTPNEESLGPSTSQRQSPSPRIANHSPASATPSIVVRPPDAFEQALVRFWTTQAKAEQFQADALVEAAIDALRNGELSAARTMAHQMIPRRAYYERRLFDNARYFDGPRRAAALALLGEIGTLRVVGDVALLVDHDRSAAAVARTVLHIAGASRIADLARRSANPVQRQAYLKTLLVADDASAREAFLKCVLSPELRADCLLAARASAVLPEEYLFAQLTARNQAWRMAAAAVLAQSSSPQTIDRMIALVRSGVAVDAAVVALVGSAQPPARSFVNQLRATPNLIASMNAAANQWQQFVGNNGRAL